jgi:predicted nucleic acid-binding protein
VIFVDTSAWYAVSVPADPNYQAATAWINQNGEPLITTDYIIDETLTLFRSRGEHVRALRVGTEVFSGNRCQLCYLTPTVIAQAWVVFQQFKDKDWSFTDCTSKVVMEQLGITAAFAFDHHFHQFGSVVVVP